MHILGEGQDRSGWTMCAALGLRAQSHNVNSLAGTRATVGMGRMQEWCATVSWT